MAYITKKDKDKGVGLLIRMSDISIHICIHIRMSISSSYCCTCDIRKYSTSDQPSPSSTVEKNEVAKLFGIYARVPPVTRQQHHNQYPHPHQQ